MDLWRKADLAIRQPLDQVDSQSGRLRSIGLREALPGCLELNDRRGPWEAYAPHVQLEIVTRVVVGTHDRLVTS